MHTVNVENMRRVPLNSPQPTAGCSKPVSTRLQDAGRFEGAMLAVTRWELCDMETKCRDVLPPLDDLQKILCPH